MLAARAVLGATMGAVATVLASIFSVALLVLSMVSTLFGPRLLHRCLKDWVTQEGTYGQGGVGIGGNHVEESAIHPSFDRWTSPIEIV